MTNRKAGYYWVKDGLGWEPLRWSGCVWDGHLNDGDLEEVGHRIPEPDEPWQCVPVEATDEMVEAGYMKIDLKQKWGVMLATAPKPEN